MLRGKEIVVSGRFGDLAGFLFCIALALATAGCGGGSDSPAANPPMAPAPPAPSGSMPVTSGPSTFTVGGAVSGLVAGTQLTLDHNGVDALTVGVNGAFTFTSPVPLDGSFAVTVGSQPAGQVCTVSSGSGNGVTANVTGVGVSCAGSPEFAYVANVNSNTVSQYTIGADGALVPISPATVSTPGPVSIVTARP